MKRCNVSIWRLAAALAPFWISTIVVLLAAGCGPKVEPREVHVRLGWQVNANSAGQVAAVEKGFYLDEGLDVKLLPGGLASPSVVTVAAGSDDIGFANAPDLVISARSSGAPLKIVAVIQQVGYHGFMIRADSPIRTPHDFENRRVGVKYASPTYLLYQVLLHKLDIDRATITEIPLQYGIQPFMSGEIDVYPGAMTNEAVSIELKGVPLKIIRPADYGIQTCGNVIIAAESTIRDDPQFIRKFVKATIRGWQWCLQPENADSTVQFLKRHNDQIDPEKERIALEMNAELVMSDGMSPTDIGRIDSDKLQQIIGYMRQFGVLDDSITVADLSSPAFLPRSSE